VSSYIKWDEEKWASPAPAWKAHHLLERRRYYAFFSLVPPTCFMWVSLPIILQLKIIFFD
jgi:hypothetical protein